MAVADKVLPINHPTYPGRLSVRAMTGLLEGASQSYKAGAVVLASSGKVVIGTNGGATAILGLADKKATGVTNSEAVVLPALGLEFEISLEDQSAGDHVLAQTDLFAQYGLYIDSNGSFYANFNDTSNKAVTIVGFVDPVGTKQARVRAKFLGSTTVFA